MTDHQKPAAGIRRRGFILGMLSAATVPKILVTETPALGALIESASAQATAITAQTAPIATDALLTEYFGYSAMRLSLGNAWLAAQLVRKELTSQLALDSSPEGIAALKEINALPPTNKLVEILQSPPSTMHTSGLGNGITQKRIALELKLLDRKPSASELNASFEALKQKEPDVYRLYFGDAPVDQAAERFSRAFSSGEHGLREFKQEMKAYEKRIFEHELEMMLSASQPKFADMRSAHIIGGYPIPDNFYKSGQRELVGNRRHSGEWSERIKPADEKAPFPLSR